VLRSDASAGDVTDARNSRTRPASRGLCRLTVFTDPFEIALVQGHPTKKGHDSESNRRKHRITLTAKSHYPNGGRRIS
jgi:hypothetical protein